MNDRYNGWANRETWLVNLWYNPETKSDLDWAKDDLETQLEALGNCCLVDMVDLGAIDWRELEESLESDEDEDEGEN